VSNLTAQERHAISERNQRVVRKGRIGTKNFPRLLEMYERLVTG